MALTYTFQMPGNTALRPVTVYNTASVQQATGTLDENAVFTASLEPGDYFARASAGRTTYEQAGTVDRGDEDAFGADGGSSALAPTLGEQAGAIVQPWRPSAPIGPELWVTSKMQAGSGLNNTELSKTLTANGVEQSWRTVVFLGNLANGDRCFRLGFDYDIATIPDGWVQITLALTDNGGNVLSGTTTQVVTTRESPRKAGRFEFDFNPTDRTGDVYLQVRMQVYNNATSGTASIANVTLREVADVSRPLLVSQQYQGAGYPFVYWQRPDHENVWKVAGMSFGDDSNLAVAFNKIDAYADDAPFANDPPDPAFARSTPGPMDLVNGQFIAISGVELRSNNNDQILEVWNGSAWELRANVHGGEFVRGTVTYEADYGSGFVPWTLSNGLETMRRFQVNLPTEIRRSTDGTTPFAHVDHVFTMYPDGVVRCDRTTTFLVDTQVRTYFEWMSSHNVGVNYLGRFGAGLDSLKTVDMADGKVVAGSDTAAWAAVKEPTNGWVTGLAYDRDASLARPDVAAVRTRVMRGDGIRKIYSNLYWAGGAESVTLEAGTEWTATHWSMTYLPQDPDQWHRELASRAVDLAGLKDVYPAT